MTAVPIPTPIYRFVHVDNLEVFLHRGALHAPNHTPEDGHVYLTIHNLDIQQHRRVRQIPRGPGDVIHDYVSFYFGALSPMLLQLHTGRVEGYAQGQEPLIYLVSSAQIVEESGARFVFSDGHGIAAFTILYDDLASLDQVDWSTVSARYWKDTLDDMDRKRRKQAEFLINRECDWALIQEIGVVTKTMKTRVEGILSRFDCALHRPVNVRQRWYY